MTSKRNEMIIGGTDFLLKKYKFLAPIKPKRKQPRILYLDKNGKYADANWLIGQKLEKLYGWDLDTSIVSEVKSHIKDRNYDFDNVLGYQFNP
jgi:hypothetical protein